jgi:FSR family fosmidomycin resistance protein-like MFS transporter
MARWTLAGSVGVVTGSLAIGLLLTLGINWRVFYLVTAVITLMLVIYLWRTPFPVMPYDNEEEEASFWTRFKTALGNLRDLNVVRWFLLLEVSDLMLDVLFSYLTLYFVDVVGATPEQAALGVAVWTTVGLIGDAALVPILERVEGVRYLRLTIPIQAAVYTGFLLVPSFEAKVVLAGINGFLNAGWYAILQANVYTSLPNQSASVLLLGNVFSIIHLSFPFIVGWLAERNGLASTMVFPLFACVIIWLGMPWGKVESRKVKVER